MELRQIEFFLQLYKDRNITVASQNLYISQQGMSKSIANLEKEVGFPLFKRSVSGVKYRGSTLFRGVSLPAVNSYLQKKLLTNEKE